MSAHEDSAAFNGARHEGHFVDQQHAAYPPSAHGVWRAVLERNAALIAEYGHLMNSTYVQGLRELELPDHIPRIEQLNRRLASTGWQTICVDGYIPSTEYARLIAQGIFPVSRVVRRLDHIEFAPEPDLVHDVLGHLPMLFSREYRLYLRRFGAVMSRARSNALDKTFFATVRQLATIKSDVQSPASEVDGIEARMLGVIRSTAMEASELTHLRRLYVWSVEFGVMGSPDDFSIHGAALLSAPAEFRGLCATGAACLRPFSINVIEVENPFSDLLSGYFIARDFSHLHDVLSEYESKMLGSEDVRRASEVRQLSRRS